MDALNSTGVIQTVASCQGHGYGLYGKPPYVYFRASVQSAALIAQTLREALHNDLMQTEWVVAGYFNDRFELMFLLHSPKYHQEYNALKYTCWLFLVWRKKIDTELRILVDLVEQTMLLNTGNKNKPCIATGSNDQYYTDQPG